jgi:hypothetical protein
MQRFVRGKSARLWRGKVKAIVRQRRYQVEIMDGRRMKNVKKKKRLEGN